MNELGGFVGLVVILGVALLLIYVNVLILRWMFKIDRIVFRLDQIATGIDKLNKTMSAAHPMPEEPPKAEPSQQSAATPSRHPRYS